MPLKAVTQAMLVSGCEDQYVRIFDLNSGAEVATLVSLEGPVQTVGFGQEGYVFAGGAERTSDSSGVTTGWARLWRVGSSKEVKTFFNGASQLSAVVAASNGIISGDAAGAIKFWSYDGSVTRTLRAGSSILSAALSADERWLVVGEDAGVDLYDLKSPQAKPRHLYEGSEIWALSFDPTGERVAFGSDRKLCICPLDAPTHPCKTLEHRGGKIWSVSYSPDGKEIATAGGDNSVRLWDVEREVETHRFNGHTGDAYSVVYVSSGMLASGSVDRTIRLLDAGDLTLRGTFEGHKGSIANLSFDRPGNRVASASLDHTIRLWTIKDGSSINLGIDERPVWWVSVSQNGRYLASASLSREIRVWDLAAVDQFFNASPASLLKQAQEQSGLEIVDETLRPACPKCSSLQVKSSQRSGPFDWFFRIFGHKPYRCQICSARFFFKS